ncbi:MAG TPA: hypothetical protein VG893_14465 [Terracidiphilus sp.]|nr:hypothetical protein [Terracidiphilus sp.]
MTLVEPRSWETAAGLVLAVSAIAGAVWWFRRRRPTADELERIRRATLASTGRLVDGMLLDVCEMEADDGRTLTLIEYSYRIAGVEYACSQDITTLRETLDPAEIRAGFPCSVRYLQHSPQNSIVVAEQWSGLRDRLPQLPQRAIRLSRISS